MASLPVGLENVNPPSQSPRSTHLQLPDLPPETEAELMDATTEMPSNSVMEFFFPKHERLALKEKHSSPADGKPLPTSDKTQVKRVVKKNRVRKYFNDSRDNWVVYFRPKGENTKWNVPQIAKDLMKYYGTGIVQIIKVNRFKLRVILNNAKQANEIVSNLLFTLEYRVWIPAHSVEIEGVVTDENLSKNMLMKGVGIFKKPNLPNVEIVECQQMVSAIANEANKKQYSPSASWRVTFAGTALPDFILLDKLRLTVRLYVPRVMSCTNCQQLGHTTTYCSNKSKCSKCGGNHKVDVCQEENAKCVLCGESPHDTVACPKYKERKVKLQRSLKERSKRSFADILKSAERQNINNNPFAELSDEESDEESDSTEEEVVWNSSGQGPKRKKTSQKIPRKVPKADKKKDTGAIPKNTTTTPSPDLQNEKEFPDLDKRKKKVRTQQTQESSEQKSFSDIITDDSKIPFSMIMDWILSVVGPAEKIILEKLIPFVKKLGKMFAPKLTILGFISFDD